MTDQHRPRQSVAVWPGSMYEPLNKQNAGERIAERMVTAIALGQFVSGQRLPAERDLAELLGVSRSSVRDAIARLCTSGYLEVRRGRSGGAFVTTEWGPDSETIIRRVLLPDWERLKHLLDFRCGVEGEVARLAAERRTPGEALKIERAAHAYLDSGTDRESSKNADQALHQAIAAATHNPFWEQLSIQVRHEVTFGLGSEPFNAGLRKRAEMQHPELAEAVAEGRPEHAAVLARNHFALNIETIAELLASVSPPPGGRPTGRKERPAPRRAAPPAAHAREPAAARPPADPQPSKQETVPEGNRPRSKGAP